jgi:hypothetical protein
MHGGGYEIPINRCPENNCVFFKGRKPEHGTTQLVAVILFFYQ